MIKFYIVDGFEEFNREWVVTTLYDELGREIMSGNQFHDNIDDLIEGFLRACSYLGVEYILYRAKLED